MAPVLSAPSGHRTPARRCGRRRWRALAMWNQSGECAGGVSAVQHYETACWRRDLAALGAGIFPNARAASDAMVKLEEAVPRQRGA